MPPKLQKSPTMTGFRALTHSERFLPMASPLPFNARRLTLRPAPHCSPGAVQNSPRHPASTTMAVTSGCLRNRLNQRVPYFLHFAYSRVGMGNGSQLGTLVALAVIAIRDSQCQMAHRLEKIRECKCARTQPMRWL
jgi:hypothetical protein